MAIAGTGHGYLHALISGKKIVEALKAGKDVCLHVEELGDDNELIHDVYRVIRTEEYDVDGVIEYTCYFTGKASLTMFGYGDLDLVSDSNSALQMAIEAGLIEESDIGPL